jgi:hypothetical protein
MTKSKWPRIRWNQANAELANSKFKDLFANPVEQTERKDSMIEKQLSELEALAAKATPGPWLITLPEGGVGYTDGAIVWGEAVPSDKPGWVEDGVNIGEMAPADDDYIGAGEIRQNSNGLFVAAARTAVPELIAEVRRLRAACHGLIDYRDRNSALNFQLEKADDFIHQMRIALEGQHG